MADHWHCRGYSAVHLERQCEGARNSTVDYRREHPVRGAPGAWKCMGAHCDDKLVGCKICNPDP